MGNVIFDVAGKDDISELVRLRIAYMIDDFGSISENERKSMEEQLPGYFDRRLDLLYQKLLNVRLTDISERICVFLTDINTESRD